MKTLYIARYFFIAALLTGGLAWLNLSRAQRK